MTAAPGISTFRADHVGSYLRPRRIEEATQYVPLDQCCLSHQCGFFSTAHGNELTEDDQWKKLARCVEVAGEVWCD